MFPAALPFAAALAALAAAPAAAQTATPAPAAEALASLAAVAQALEARGYVLLDVEREDDGFEIEAVRPDGTEIEAMVDAEGKILRERSWD